MKSGIRIIGGKCRGKKISVLDISGLRPTPNRVKETLFNWIRQKIAGAYCLDAFAGSGSLGFEASSQGATHVVMIESAKVAYNNLKKEAEQWNKDYLSASDQNTNLTIKPIEVIYGRAQDFMKKSQSIYDVVFLDPPFNESDLLECLDILLCSKYLLKLGSLVYVESSQELSKEQVGWEIIKSKKAGQVYYSLLEKKF